MNNNQEMIVHLDLKDSHKHFTFILMIAAAGFGLLKFYEPYLKWYPYIFLTIKWILILYTAMIGSIVFYIITQLYNPKPALIINEDGIWFRQIGFVAWKHIISIGTYAYLPNNPYTALQELPLHIQISNQADWENVDWLGKIKLIRTRLFKRPINLYFTMLDTPTDEIIRFTKQYHQKRSS